MESTADDGLPRPSPEDIAIDDDLECHGEMTDAEICAAVRGSQSESDSDDEANEGDSPDASTSTERQELQVSKGEALLALSTLRSYLQQNCTEYDSFFDMERKIQESVLSKQVQTKLSDFFPRQ